MRQYSRVLAGIAMLAFVLAAMPVVTCAAQATDTGTAAKTKRKSRKAKTADTAATASTAAPAAPATTPAPPPKAASKTPAPVANASASDIAAAKAAGKVWVNTDTGIYHKGGRWYGKTKQGKFMSEDEAKKAGYHEAKAEIGAKKT
ncbi:MAG TPA: hypothetical protein VGK64_31310 [Bryobacteraceae bacterium]